MQMLLCTSLQDKQLWSAFGDILKDETKLSKADLLSRRKGGKLNKENVSKQNLLMPKHEDTKANLNQILRGNPVVHQHYEEENKQASGKKNMPKRSHSLKQNPKLKLDIQKGENLIKAIENTKLFSFEPSTS